MPADIAILGALSEKTGVVSLKFLKKALYPALDPRYHSMANMNSEAMEKGAAFVRDRS
jgi:Pyruvate/2-oxoacid:ferredoxin oxidoreductase gamma subunit